MKAAFNTHTDYVTLLKYSKGKEGEKEKKGKLNKKSHRCLSAQVGILFMNLEQNYI